VGNLKDSKDGKQLDSSGITHILSAYDGAKRIFREKKYLLLSVADSPRQDMLRHVAQSNDFVHAARLRGGQVLIHW